MAIASRVTKRALSTFAAAAAKLPEAVAAAAAGEVATAAVPERAAAKVLEFEDTGRLFAGEPTSALVRTLAALQALSVGPLVDAATAALRSPAVAGSALGRAAARATAYRHFCAGEAAGEAAAVVRRLWRGGMGGILDYGIEDAEDGRACDRNAAGFISAVDVAAALPPGSIPRTKDNRRTNPSRRSQKRSCTKDRRASSRNQTTLRKKLLTLTRKVGRTILNSANKLYLIDYAYASGVA